MFPSLCATQEPMTVLQFRWACRCIKWSWLDWLGKLERLKYCVHIYVFVHWCVLFEICAHSVCLPRLSSSHTPGWPPGQHTHAHARVHTHTPRNSLTVWCACNIMRWAVHLEEKQTGLLFSPQVKYWSTLLLSSPLLSTLSLSLSAHVEVWIPFFLQRL